MKRAYGKKIICSLLSVLMTAGLLAGCGNTQNGTGTNASGNVTGDNTSNVTEDTGMSAYTGANYSKDTDGIVVTLALDKESYEAGEEIKYALTIDNEKSGFTISKVFVENSCDDVLKADELPSFPKTIAYGDTSVYEGSVSSSFEGTATEAKKTAVSGDVEDTIVRPYVKVNYGGEEVMVRFVLEIISFQKSVSISSDSKKTVKTVSCHDPSIVVGTDNEGKKCYYIFGSHLAWAKSYDLENWTTFTNNINSDYSNIFAEPAKWSAHGSSNYSVNGYMWAPDVIYNTEMGKWCMYMSIDGDSWYSSIVMLTADSLEGDWTYQGIVIYSGFSKADYYSETDVAKVTGETTLASRYNVGNKWGDYFPNNIDPCVFYDDDGNLWMSYGSWSGGIFMIELDEATGFRDYDVSYENNAHSDPYFGKKIAGGKYVSGEASYIQKIGDYYWLFVCYGGLESTGGYNVRVYRSTTPDGGYVDELGNTPYFDTWKQNYNLSIGVRLFGGYKWNTFSKGQLSQGHNSAFVDDDGKAYIVFHTRTTDGSEGHYVKVHQLFLNENGWLVAAPYQTSGETLEESGYSVSEVAGSYDVIMHTLNLDYENREVNKTQSITLNEDGTITGAYEGTWSLKAGTPYIELNIGGVCYSGVTLKMEIENTTIETMTFTALGEENQITFWGSKSIE